MALTTYEAATSTAELESSQNLPGAVGSLAVQEAFASLEMFSEENMARNQQAYQDLGVRQPFPEMQDIVNAFRPKEQALAVRLAKQGLLRSLIISPAVKPHGGLAGGFEDLVANYNNLKAQSQREVAIAGNAELASWYRSRPDYNHGNDEPGLTRVSLWLSNDSDISFREKTAKEQREVFLQANETSPEGIRFAGLTAVDYLVMHAIERQAGKHAERGFDRTARILPDVAPEQMPVDTHAVTTTPTGEIHFNSLPSGWRSTFVTSHRAIEAVI